MLRKGEFLVRVLGQCSINGPMGLGQKGPCHSGYDPNRKNSEQPFISIYGWGKKNWIKRHMWSKTTLITSGVGGEGVDLPPRKLSTFSLRSLALRVIRILPIYCSYIVDVSCWLKKKCIHFCRGGSTLVLPSPLVIWIVSLLIWRFVQSFFLPTVSTEYLSF